MTRLLLVELTRLRWRRAVVLLLLGAVVVPVLAALLAIVGHAPPGREYAQREAERTAAVFVEDCERDRAARTPPERGFRRTCEQLNPPGFYVPYDQLSLDDERLAGSGLVAAVVVVLVAVLVGTTFVGHDWNTGSMSNQLLFEPRRERVWLAKGAAVLLAGGVTAAVATTLLWLVLATRYWTVGADLPGDDLLEGLQQGWRASVLAGCAALGGFALTMLSRSTVATLGVLFGATVAGGLLLGLVVDDRGWLDPSLNALAVVQDGAEYTVVRDSGCSSAAFSDAPPCYEVKRRSLAQGSLQLGVLLGLGSAASVASYRRRDVP